MEISIFYLFLKSYFIYSFILMTKQKINSFCLYYLNELKNKDN